VIVRPRKRCSKYNAAPTFVDGIRFPSKREAARYVQLTLARRGGEVLRFWRQVPFDLPGGVKYRLDFMVHWKDGNVTYEDVKGVRTPVYKLKKKQVEELYALKITEI